MFSLSQRSATFETPDGGARVHTEGPGGMPQLTWPDDNHAVEPASDFPGPSTCLEAALGRKHADFRILLGYAKETPEARSLEFFFLVHGYDVQLAAGDRAFLDAARDGAPFDAIVVDETITDQTLNELCQIPRATFVPIIEFTRTKLRSEFVSAAIRKPCRTDGIVRTLDAVISIARDVRRNGYIRAAFPELAELDEMFGPAGV